MQQLEVSSEVRYDLMHKISFSVEIKVQLADGQKFKQKVISLKNDN